MHWTMHPYSYMATVVTNTCFYLKPTACVSIDPDCTATLLVKLLNDCNYLCWKPILLEDFPQRWPVNTVESLAEVDEIHYHRPTSFRHFLNDLPQGEELICTGSATPVVEVTGLQHPGSRCSSGLYFVTTVVCYRDRLGTAENHGQQYWKDHVD